MPWNLGSDVFHAEGMTHLSTPVPRSCVPRGAARCRDLAERIAYTCWQMYEAQPSGIGPERVKGLKIDLSRTDTKECV